MNSPSPAATLLIPCFNAARFLPRLLDGVRAMTTPFAAVLAYDDGSTDDTVAVARSLEIEIITPNRNRGVSVARNRLAAAAKTEWIHFHDADDRIAPDFLERLGPLADADADVVSCDADWIGEHDGALQVAWRYDGEALARDPAAHLLVRPMGLNNTLLRRAAWEQSGGCDERLAMWEDADVHFRLALAGARWRHLSAVLTWSLRNPASFSHDHRKSSRCRLAALGGYAAMDEARRLLPLVAYQAEELAAAALGAGDRAVARECVSLCHRLGFPVPSSRNPVFRAARRLLPSLFLLRLQRRLRAACAG